MVNVLLLFFGTWRYAEVQSHVVGGSLTKKVTCYASKTLVVFSIATLLPLSGVAQRRHPTIATNLPAALVTSRAISSGETHRYTIDLEANAFYAARGFVAIGQVYEFLGDEGEKHLATENYRAAQKLLRRHG